jgi:hypothetical protein
LLVNAKESKKVEVSEAAKQDLARLEFSAIDHDIFLTIFMNRTIILTKDNISKIEAFAKGKMKNSYQTLSTALFVVFSRYVLLVGYGV